MTTSAPLNKNGGLAQLDSPLALSILTFIAAAAALTRRADGSNCLSTGAGILLQLPALVAWIACHWLGTKEMDSSKRSDRGLTVFVLAAGLAIGIWRRSIESPFLAATTFIAGSLLVDSLGRLFHRIAEQIENPSRLLRTILVPWLGMIALATPFLACPLATRSGVPDYAHNFWQHVVASFYDAVNAACLIGSPVYSFGEDHSFFGQAVLLLVTQISGMGFAAAGLAAIRPFLQRPVRLGTVLQLSLALQLIGALLLAVSSPTMRESPPFGRLWWGLVHATSAIWNTGFTLRTAGVIDDIRDPIVFASLTTLAIVGSLGLPIICDLLFAVRGRPPSPSSSDSTPPWRHLPHWEAGAAFVLLLMAAMLLFMFETPRVLPPSLVPSRPVDFGGGRISIRDAMQPGARWNLCVFVSTALRSSGLQSTSLSSGAISLPSYFLMLVWMLVGGSAAGVAGGGRHTVLTLSAICLVYSRRSWAEENHGAWLRTWLGRRLLLGLLCWALAALSSAALLAAVTDATRYETLFDAVAALGNVGLSTGLSLHLTPLGRLAMILIMVFGRVAPVAFWLSISRTLTQACAGGIPGAPNRP